VCRMKLRRLRTVAWRIETTAFLISELS
ncbi:hypothetical protein BMAJHU_I0714, partial [Burkholderia mallei JHU]